MRKPHSTSWTIFAASTIESTNGGTHCEAQRRDQEWSVNVEPRHSIACDQRPLRVRPKSARESFPVGRNPTVRAALEQGRVLAVHFGRYVARIDVPGGVVVRRAASNGSARLAPLGSSFVQAVQGSDRLVLAAQA